MASRPDHTETPPQARRNRPGWYRRAATLLVCLLVFYPTAAIVGPSGNKPEFYPFFVWSLFTYASRHRADAVLIVDSINGETLEKPTMIFDLPERLEVRGINRTTVAKLVERIVIAAWNKSDEQARLLGVLEQTYLKRIPHLRYRVAVITYDPIERLRSGTIEKTEIIATRGW